MSAELSTAADPERAAVLVMLLAEEDATGLLARLSPEELRLLGSKMYGLGEIGPGAIATSAPSARHIRASARPALRPPGTFAPQSRIRAPASRSTRTRSRCEADSTASATRAARRFGDDSSLRLSTFPLP